MIGQVALGLSASDAVRVSLFVLTNSAEEKNMLVRSHVYRGLNYVHLHHFELKVDHKIML